MVDLRLSSIAEYLLLHFGLEFRLDLVLLIVIINFTGNYKHPGPLGNTWCLLHSKVV